MPNQDINVSHVLPVFALSKNLPDKVDIITICSAGERVVGTSGIEGAYQDGGLWRIYPMTPAGRVLLLAQGISIDNQRVALEATNPFILKGENFERPSTRLSVGPLPKSISDDALIRALERNKTKIRSKIINEMVRYKDRTLIEWKTIKGFAL